NDGVWSLERVVLSIIIVPPFWQTLWFKFLAAIFIIGGIYALFYLQKRSAKKRQDILEAEVKKRTEDLESAILELNEENESRMRAEHKLRLAQSESNAILENVNEGLFLLNHEYEISEQHSRELEVIFDHGNLAKFNFIKLMEKLITKKNLESLKKYLEVQFNKNIDEDVFKNLNPLESVEVHLDSKNAEFVSKYLKFSFSRVMDGDTIFSLLVAVQDITKVVQLQQQLEESQKKQRQEIDQLLSILKVDPVELREYIESVESTLEKITKSFKEDDQDYDELLADVFKKVHNLKGNAGFLDMKFFVDKFHNIEETIKKLQEQESLSGNDFLHILFEMNQIRKYIVSMNQLIDRVLNMSKQINRSVSAEEKRDILVSGFSKRVNQLNSELGKKAKFIFENTNNLMIPDQYETAFKDIVIHLINNSMVHGVESQEERKKNKKKPEALLKVEVNQANGTFGFKFTDDGKGLNLEKIKNKAIESGRYEKADLDKMSDEELADLIFQDGISTAEKVDENAGRGQGMSIIKDIVKQVNGEVILSSKLGEFFEANIALPL
ncbi:MAG: hypothetical protein KDD94_04015, partial [Calditrichaeota bacterium]|nr:hypothetical protein [Calditrichota bacterium]